MKAPRDGTEVNEHGWFSVELFAKSGGQPENKGFWTQKSLFMVFGAPPPRPELALCSFWKHYWRPKPAESCFTQEGVLRLLELALFQDFKNGQQWGILE